MSQEETSIFLSVKCDQFIHFPMSTQEHSLLKETFGVADIDSLSFE